MMDDFRRKQDLSVEMLEFFEEANFGLDS